jgi:hypothetical protein
MVKDCSGPVPTMGIAPFHLISAAMLPAALSRRRIRQPGPPRPKRSALDVIMGVPPRPRGRPRKVSSPVTVYDAGVGAVPTNLIAHDSTCSQVISPSDNPTNPTNPGVCTVKVSPETFDWLTGRG